MADPLLASPCTHQVVVVDLDGSFIEASQVGFVDEGLVEEIPVEESSFVLPVLLLDGLLVGVDHGVVEPVGAGLCGNEDQVPACGKETVDSQGNETLVFTNIYYPAFDQDW